MSKTELDEPTRLIQIAVSEPGDEMPVREDRIPLAWYVQPWRSHSLSSTAERASEPWGHSLPAARTALMNRRSKSV